MAEISSANFAFHDVRMQGFRTRMEVEALQALVLAHLPAPVVQPTPLEQAAGRVLAQDIVSPCAVPPFDRAAVDGYALHAEDTFGAHGYDPRPLKLVGELHAGERFRGRIRSGEALRIMTGAPLPAGANAVLMAEQAHCTGTHVEVLGPVSPLRHVGRKGEDVARGATVLRASRVLRAQDLGLLASIGCAQVLTYARPRISLVVTGNELLPPGSRPHGAKIVDANSLMLAALIARDGGELQEVLRLPDKREVIRDALLQVDPGASAKGAQSRTQPSTFLIVSGGSSVGTEDHVPSLVAEYGELLAHGVAMRPSAPTGFGVVRERPVFLLPGHPVSCLAAYDFFAALALRAFQQAPQGWPYLRCRARLGRRISSILGRLDYVRVRRENEHVIPLATRGASALSTVTQADGFVLVPASSEGYAEGEEITLWRY